MFNLSEKKIQPIDISFLFPKNIPKITVAKEFRRLSLCALLGNVETNPPHDRMEQFDEIYSLQKNTR